MNIRCHLNKGDPRPFGTSCVETQYPKGHSLDTEENREVEFKEFTGESPGKLPWKIMEKAKKFICGCLNGDRKGIIYFGVRDSGEVVGLVLNQCLKDDIVKAFQAVLNDHMKSDQGPLVKVGDQNCVNLEFVRVTEAEQCQCLFIVEIEVSRDWKFCKNKVYYSKVWTEKRSDSKGGEKKRLSDFYKVADKWGDAAVRTCGSSQTISHEDLNNQVKEPLSIKFKEWKRQTKTGKHYTCLPVMKAGRSTAIVLVMFSVIGLSTCAPSINERCMKEKRKTSKRDCRGLLVKVDSRLCRGGNLPADAKLCKYHHFNFVLHSCCRCKSNISELNRCFDNSYRCFKK